MALSTQQFTSTGVEDHALLTFPYLQRQDIHMYVNTVEYPFTWASDSRINFAPAPVGAEVVIKRITTREKLAYQLQEGAPFTRQILDLIHTQLLYLEQEGFEGAISAIYGDVDLHGFRVRNAGDPVAPKDYTTKQWVEHQILSAELGDPSQATSLRAQAREALRRSYAEAGYNVVAGSFEAGGVLVNPNDVLLHEASGRAFSGPAGAVGAGTNPISGGFVDRGSSLLRLPALAGIYSDWKANLAGRGITLVAGSFEEGASTTKPNDAVMHYATGTPYLLKSGANASIPAGDTPNSDWAPVRLIEPLPVIANSKVAHRCLTPENTILALGSCRRSGFDAVETDAKQSADGVWYIFHDDAVDNLTNGTGTFSSLPSSYIKTLRFDSLAGGKYADEPVPLVTDFLKAALIKGLTVYLEIKSYLTYDDIAGLVAIVEGLNAGNGVVICSMDIAVLRYIRFMLNSDVPLQYVYEGTDYIGAIDAVLSLQRTSFSYFNNYVRQHPAVVGACAKAGVSLFAWTIINKKTADQCSRIGATNIVTDIVL